MITPKEPKKEVVVCFRQDLCINCQKTVENKVNIVNANILVSISDIISALCREGWDYSSIANRIGCSDKYIIMLKNYEHYESIKKLRLTAQVKLFEKFNNLFLERQKLEVSEL